MDESYDDAEIDRLLDELPVWAFEPLPKDDEEEIVNGAARQLNGRFGIRRDRDYRAAGWHKPGKEPLAAEARRIAFLLKRAQNGDAAVVLQAISALRHRVEHLEHEAVVLARSYGWAWRDIASVLGLATQTVHRRYAKENLVLRKKRRRDAS